MKSLVSKGTNMNDFLAYEDTEGGTRKEKNPVYIDWKLILTVIQGEC